ncbi:S-adenosyl methyltransferase [Frankia torreyi]|uniref:S-adenosyl methyltransferase n=1 Tax=Frankia torreyi TaxID=1856 RepID=A0A0D8BMG0_9ACTN|nr:SAM-dependent methyltransferase [Frankia sp. CpI1-P]KJE25265.1 S-adenosyl methyltransferase [Frankia torreyi]KQM07919.1 S-adenosyl methyltransferase [Frankia sp. CpI1-P]
MRDRPPTLRPDTPGSDRLDADLRYRRRRPRPRRCADSYRQRAITARLRSRAEAESLFTGLELPDPGVVFVHRWRPDADVPAGLTDAAVNIYGGLARKV